MATLVSEPIAGTVASMASVQAAPSKRPRDLRLDVFRGLGLLLIFINHVPDNPLYWFTLAGVAFCDAADLFVFISGYAAALVFGGVAGRSGMLFAAAQILRRCWTLYVAHIFLFVLFTAQVAWAVQRLDNPMFAEELNVASFLREPHVAVMKALLLQLQPIYMNILPLYIVLLGALIVVLPILRYSRWLVVGLSAVAYLAVLVTDMNFASYPDGHWYFNPFAWQALFFAGVVLGWRHEVQARVWAPPRGFVLGCAVVLALCLALKAAFNFGWLPGPVMEIIWTVADKTDAGPLRIVNFLTLAVVVIALVPMGAAWLAQPWLRPLVIMGQNALNVFCFGIFLTVLAHALMIELEGRYLAPVLATLGGAVAMYLLALWGEWTKGRGGPRVEGA
jgi:hypothetical protein